MITDDEIDSALIEYVSENTRFEFDGKAFKKMKSDLRQHIYEAELKAMQEWIDKQPHKKR